MIDILTLICNKFLLCVVNVAAVLYVISVILNKKIDFKNYKTYLIIFCLIILLILNFLLVNDLVRILISTIIVGFANYLLFNENIKTTITSTLLEQIISILPEIVYAISIIVILGADGHTIINKFYGESFSVIIISLIAVLIVNVKPLKKILAKLIELSQKLKFNHIAISALLFIIVINILLVVVYHELDILSLMILNLLFIFIYGIIIYNSFLDKNNMTKMQAENKALLNNLEEYEKMLDYQRVANHENKNQLLIVRSLLKENENSDALNYVNEVLDDKKDDNDVLFGRAKKIPSGGLQGIVYQKMLVMNDKNIKPILDVSNSVKKFKLENLDTKLNYDICRIVGVFLDNSIEETEKLDEREIMLSMYEQSNDLVIEISNKFKNVPDLERLEEKGYSTKGKGHGYGLSLVNDIVNNNNQIINEKGITRNIFTQKLIVKM